MRFVLPVVLDGLLPFVSSRYRFSDKEARFMLNCEYVFLLLSLP